MSIFLNTLLSCFINEIIYVYGIWRLGVICPQIGHYGALFLYLGYNGLLLRHLRK